VEESSLKDPNFQTVKL